MIISRGELVQIGGGFRIGEILETSGARLREVGATNKTVLGDYAKAIGPETGMILKVHQSNFYMSGFAGSAPNEELARLARSKRIPFVEDLGSGAVVATEKLGLNEHEPTPNETLKRGADLVCFSGDKLFGGPQAGIIAGKARFIAALKKEPLFRALRCDKLVLAALGATVDAHLRGEEVPVHAMLQIPKEELRARGQKLLKSLARLPLKARLVDCKAEIGGGTLPRSAIASVALEVEPDKISPDELAGRLRRNDPPIIGYIARGRFLLDLRTIFPAQDRAILAALNEVDVKNFILATAGHVDHGKTALVKALTGVDTDRLPEEKARGITIDLGFAHLELPGVSLGLIDVPGHEDFIRNMIAGLGAIDLALLVVAADDGWMPQTEEHWQILNYLGVRRVVVAITKCDLGDAAPDRNGGARKTGNSLVRRNTDRAHLRPNRDRPGRIEGESVRDLRNAPGRAGHRQAALVRRSRLHRARHGNGRDRDADRRTNSSKAIPSSLQPQNLRARVRDSAKPQPTARDRSPGDANRAQSPRSSTRGHSARNRSDYAGNEEASRTIDVLLDRAPSDVAPAEKRAP